MEAFIAFCVVCALLLVWAFIDVCTPSHPPFQPPSKATPPDSFTCSHCGSGPWHNSWSPEFNPPICPNCSGAD